MPYLQGAAWEFAARVSPNGSWLAYQGDVLGDGNRFLVAVATQARPRDIRLIFDWTAMLKR